MRVVINPVFVHRKLSVCFVPTRCMRSNRFTTVPKNTDINIRLLNSLDFSDQNDRLVRLPLHHRLERRKRD
ncbi:hypothetical protein AB6A40_011006 [Gnathostoma spinigerum]|uniref:Uncharacterized protein n=1 Tax=Gnathostoma spinigerum TaxID=75299 RepID=A0ABD6EYW9_9BILA